jgi:hypothetical protein
MWGEPSVDALPGSADRGLDGSAQHVLEVRAGQPDVEVPAGQAHRQDLRYAAKNRASFEMTPGTYSSLS